MNIVRVFDIILTARFRNEGERPKWGRLGYCLYNNSSRFITGTLQTFQDNFL